MGLAEFLAELDSLEADAKQAFNSAQTEIEHSAAARRDFLAGRSSHLKFEQKRLKDLQKRLGAIPRDEKPAAGKAYQTLKQSFEASLGILKAQCALSDTSDDTHEKPDPTLPGTRPRIGHLHPITQTIEELKDIMGRLGFSVADGPEIEDEWHNFEALNIPASHPARDPLENFYLATAQRATGHPLLLRSQTSTVQIRVMEQTRPPVRVISLGRVYRPDTADATHYPMFHQIEGLLVDRHVTMADLKSVLRLFAMSYFGGEVHIRFRPSFFPFTEPSVEVDMQWHDRWIEMGGAGMVDPHVLSAVGYDPEEVTGFAFGLGVERVCMRRHGITDIREFYKNDIRFLHQF